MKKLVLLAAFAGLVSVCSFAQTALQLENGVRLFNSVIDSMAVEDSDLFDIIDEADESEALFLKVIENGSATEKNVARYFLAYMKYRMAKLLQEAGETDLAAYRQSLFDLQDEFWQIDATWFPLRYQFDGRNYEVTYPGFVFERKYFFFDVASAWFDLKDQENTRKYARKGLEIETEKGLIFDFPMHYYLFFMARNDDEAWENARKMIGDAVRIKPEDREFLKTSTDARAYMEKALKALTDGKGMPAGADLNGAESLSIARDLKNTTVFETEAAPFYLRAYEKGAAPGMDENWEVLALHEKLGLKSAGLKIANRVQKLVSSVGCEDFERLAIYFRKFGDPTAAQASQQSAQKCRAEAQKRAVEAQKRADAEAKRAAKAARKANRGKVYVGAYVLRLVQRPQYIDFGGVLNLPFRQSLWEFSYMKAINDQDYLLPERIGKGDEIEDIDNPHWDGFYAHLAWKKRARSGNGNYAGLLVNYNERNYLPQLTDVFDRTTLSPVAFGASFEPKMVSYGAMANFGSMGFRKFLGLGVDAYMGFGGTFNQFDLQNTTYPRADFMLGHPFLELRKEQFWSFQLRLGLTVGFGL